LFKIISTYDIPEIGRAHLHKTVESMSIELAMRTDVANMSGADFGFPFEPYDIQVPGGLRSGHLTYSA
jgi:hypothetical protein